MQQGRVEEAEMLYCSCLDGYTKVYGEEHPLTLEAMHSLGNFHSNQSCESRLFDFWLKLSNTCMYREF